MTPVVVTLALGVLTGALVAVLVGLRRVDLPAPHADDRMLNRRLWGHPAFVRWMRRRPSAVPVTGTALVLAAVVGILLASFLGLVLLMVSTNQALARSDLPLARWARDHATAEETEILRSISLLGGTEVVLGVAIAVALLGGRSGRRAQVAGFVAAAVLGQFVVVNVIKWVIDRARPDLGQLTGFAGASFPSGHAAAAAATWACVAMISSRGGGRWVRATTSGIGVAIAVAVGATRVFLGVHWFTDVIAGLVLGWGWFAMCSVAFGGAALHFGEPVERAEELVEPEPPTGRSATVVRHR